MDRLLARMGVLTFVCVLVCVPGLTRISQKLEVVTPISSAPSFAKNIDCPPRKVTVAPLFIVPSVVLVAGADVVRVARFVAPPDPTLPPSPTVAAPRPLRAPPAHHV
jgi:hypothetical protein